MINGSESYNKGVIIMHDSLIDNVEVFDNSTKVKIWIDFVFWMQSGYNESDPETGILIVTFDKVIDYTIPENANWNAISILETSMDQSYVKFSLINDLTDDYLELKINAESITTVSEA